MGAGEEGLLWFMTTFYDRIALNLREKGRGDDQPGRLKACQGIGWWLEEANIAQISLNLTDMDVTPMHVAYEEARKDGKSCFISRCSSRLDKIIRENIAYGLQLKKCQILVLCK